MRKICKLTWLIVVCVVCAALIGRTGLPVRAQDGLPGRVDVFVGQDPTTGAASIYFVDALSGLSTVVNVEQGQRFTLVGDYVLFEKPLSGTLMRANADGTLDPHSFIRRTADIRSIRWVTSPDARGIAWVQVDTAGVSQAFAAWADGHDLRALPILPPAPPLEMIPLALSNGLGHLLYDAAHPADPAGDAPYTRYHYLTGYSLINNATYQLAREPNCPCGAALTPDGRIFARLEAEEGIGPFALHVWEMLSEADIIIPPPALNYPLAGDLIVNNTGTRALYSASSGTGDEADPADHALVLVDMIAGQQTVILPPGPDRFRPVGFIDQDQAALLVGVTAPGTYKLNLLTGELRRVSNDTYLGTILAGS